MPALLSPLQTLLPVEVIPTSTLIDLFGRIKVSQGWNSVAIKQDTALNHTLTMSHGVVTANAGLSAAEQNSSLLMSTTGTAGYYRARSRYCGLYQNGKSLLIFFTFNFNTTGTTGVDKRAGYLYGTGATRDGIFLRQNGTTVSWNLSSALTGANTEITQANWINSLTLDWTKAQIGFITFEYLGVGDVMCGFVQDRSLKVAAVFSNKNAITLPYMQTPNLYLTYEMEISRATTNLETFRAICATQLIEGTPETDGYPVAFGSNSATMTLSPASADYAVIIFRGTNPNNRIQIGTVSIASGTNATIQTTLVKLNGTPTNLPASTTTNTIEVWFPTATNVGNLAGTVLGATTFTQATRSGNVRTNISNYLEYNFDNTAVYYAVICRSSTNNVAIDVRTIEFTVEL